MDVCNSRSVLGKTPNVRPFVSRGLHVLSNMLSGVVRGPVPFPTEAGVSGGDGSSRGCRENPGWSDRVSSVKDRLVPTPSHVSPFCRDGARVVTLLVSCEREQESSSSLWKRSLRVFVYAVEFRRIVAPAPGTSLYTTRDPYVGLAVKTLDSTFLLV